MPPIIFLPAYVRVSGAWREATPYVRRGGKWIPAVVWLRHNGKWVKVAGQIPASQF